MPIEIREPGEDELQRMHFLVAYSFSGDRSEEGRQAFRHVEEMSSPLALYDNGEMAACLRIIQLRMLVNGASLPMGGISGVASLPEQRRKGYVGQLLRHSLALMRERGQSISALYTPHPSLYRRYGWMIASSCLKYAFKPKDIAPIATAPPAGSARRITAEEWPAAAEVYRRFTAGRNGYLDRDERWWKEAVFQRLYDEKRRPNDVAVWAGAGGEPRGYVVYFSGRERRLDGPPLDRIALDELYALDGDAYAGLLRYVLSHDLAHEITWYCPIDEPFLVAIDDPQRVKSEHFYGFMLRVVDVEKAVAVRPPPAGAPEGAFTVHIADASAPWNQGAWRIECAGARLSARRSDAGADISCGADVFAAMYNGFLRPSEAVRSGLAEAPDAKALGLADAILAADHAPFPSDMF